MKLILSCIFSFFYFVALAQTNIADSGKAEFKKQASAEKPDYRSAYRILKNQVKLFPDSAELHYFLGYAIDRMNASDGSTLFQQNSKLTGEASEAFEKVNKLAPIYDGEYIVLDPYAKLSSIWGSQAQAFLIVGKKDSARWAFSEGKRRGGFIEPVLEYNRQLLKGCSKNAILITYGDNITIPVWYLQEVENLRNDITVVDANLINTNWYCKYLKNIIKLDIGFTDKEIEGVDYVEFKSRYLTISNPEDSSEKFTWQLKSTYLNNYVLKGDRILLNILKQNLFSRPVYFGINSDTTWNLFLENYMFNEGLADRLQMKSVSQIVASDSVSANLKNYSIENIDALEIKKSKDAIILLNNYRWAYYVNMARLLDFNEKAKARELKDEMEKKFAAAKLPYPFDDAKKYFAELYEKIEN